jgi:hypothetical protein
MRAEKKLLGKLESRLSQKQNEMPKQPAVFAREFIVPNHINYNYVVIGTNIVPVYNDRVAPRAGVKIWVGYDAIDQSNGKRKKFQVLATRSEDPMGGESTSLGYAPSKRYEWNADGGGQDPLKVHLRAITFLRVGMSSVAGNIQLYRGKIWSGTAFINVAQQNIDVTAQVPSTAGKAALVLITIDKTGAVVQTKGDEVDIADLTTADRPAVPADTAFVSASVRVYTGQVKPQEGRVNTDFEDLRFAWSPSSSGGVSDGDKGDITVSSSGTVWTIDNKVVTLAKMDDMATASLIYRKSGGAGAPEVNSLATLKTDLGTMPPTAHDQNADTIIIPNGAGTPAYNDLQDYFNLTQASGRLTGGVLSAHAGPNGTLDISDMEGMIHTANTLGSPLVYFKKAATASISLTDNAVNFIWITYTAPGGVPTLTYSANAARPTDDYNVFVVGRVWRSGNEVEVVNSGQNIFNMYGRQQDRLLTKYGNMDHATGSIVTQHATALRIEANAGVWYFGNSRFDTDAVSQFHVWYKTGGGAWTESALLTLFSDVFDGGTSKVYETYQNGTSLAALTGNNYGVYWIFECPEGNLYVLLGTSSYSTIASAQAAAVPASLPPYLVNWARLIGRVIVKKTASALYSVESAFAQTFSLSTTIDHNSNSNINGTSPYYHLPTPTAPAANLMNVAGIVNGETDWSNKALFDATAPADVGITAVAGISLLAAHSDHVHSGIWVLLEDIYLSAADAENIDFQNIPSTYKHLKIFTDLRSDRNSASDTTKIKFNNDAGNNYVGMYQYAGGGAEQLAGGAPYIVGGIAAGLAPANYFANAEITVYDYANTSKYHSYQGRSALIRTTAAGNAFVYDSVGIYLSTTAISRIILLPNSGTVFKRYSRATLYGLK